MFERSLEFIKYYHKICLAARLIFEKIHVNILDYNNIP